MEREIDYLNYDTVFIYLEYNKMIPVYKAIKYHKLFTNSNIITIILDDEYNEIKNDLKIKYNIYKLNDINKFKSNNTLLITYTSNDITKFINQTGINPSNIEMFFNFIHSCHGIHTRKEFDFAIAVYFHIADSCNFGCRGCTHFAPLAPKHVIIPFEEIKQDIDLVYTQMTPKRVSALRFLGGEPLLNPNITKILKYSREKFPDISQIEVLSNGFLLKKMPQEFWDVCNECDVDLAISVYNVPNYDYNALAQYVKGKGRALRLAEIKKSLNLTLQKTPRNNYNMFYECGGGSMVVINKGNVNSCFTSEYAYIFNNYFDLHLGEGDIPFTLKGHDYYEIYESLFNPKELCKYCFNTKGGTYINWCRTKKDIQEWTCDNFENS